MNNEEILPLDKTTELAQITGNNLSKTAILKLLNSRKQIILYGAPGTSKSFIANQLKGEFELSNTIQFHPNVSYEQFIGGFSIGGDGQITSRAGIFLEFCEKAKNNKSSNYLFIIDEINRGNMSKIFGEVIMALDREYDVDLSQDILHNGQVIKKFCIPNNVFIIGTMNSADRSIALVDYALRRRFTFIKFYPNYEIIHEKSNCENLDGIQVHILAEDLNRKLLSILKDEDILLGHAYFIPSWAYNGKVKIEWTKELLMELFNFSLIPIIEEYTYGNNKLLTSILGNRLPGRITDLEEFVEAIKEKFKYN